MGFNSGFKGLKTKRRPLYLKTQSVPRCKYIFHCPIYSHINVQFLSCDRSTGSCICLLCVSVIFCQQGHIHDPVLLSQDRNYTWFLLLIASISVSAILVARNVITLYCINTRTLYHGPSTTDVPHTCALVARVKVK